MLVLLLLLLLLLLVLGAGGGKGAEDGERGDEEIDGGGDGNDKGRLSCAGGGRRHRSLFDNPVTVNTGEIVGYMGALSVALITTSQLPIGLVPYLD